MSSSTQTRFFAICLGAAWLTLFIPRLSAQTNYYSTNGTEYAVIGALPGDQVFPDVAVTPAGGYVVWQDNLTDGNAWGVSARRLDSTLSGTLGTFRVNVTGAGSQENPRVAQLKGGGAVFVWQGGTPGFQHIYARFLNSTNTFVSTNDVQVNTFSNNFQINPAVAVLNNSNVVVVWASYGEAKSNSMQDVYGQILSPTGNKIGGEFLINQFINFNQRTPSVAALPGGGFVVAWVSEQERVAAPVMTANSSVIVTASTIASIAPSVDIYARTFGSNGAAAGNEFLVNTDSNPCANPVVAAAADGSFLIAWTARDLANSQNSLDIYGRTFTGSATGGTVFYINSHLYGDQYAPRISALGLDYLVTWTSLAQDGSREGVYARFVHSTGTLTGGEFRVNTTTISQQMQPSVASDGAGQFLVVWTSFNGLPDQFDLYAQRYINVAAMLQAMPAPFVWVPFVTSNNIYQPQIVVTWALLLGLSVSNYDVYVDGVSVPVTGNQWTMTAADGLTTNSLHYFQLDYVTTDGRRSPISGSTSATTRSGLSWGGIPYEWMAEHYGGYSNGQYDTSGWPPPGISLAPKLTLQQVFVSGGNPLDSGTWLKEQLTKTAQGMFLNWNTQPGATYQVQVTTNFVTWSNFGPPRFAAGTTDSIYVGGSPGYYQVVLMR